MRGWLKPPHKLVVPTGTCEIRAEDDAEDGDAGRDHAS
jgi:hypothetical protein